MPHAAPASTIDAGTPVVLAERWGLAALQQQLVLHCPGVQADVLAETASTNTELLARARAGSAAPWVLAAERQTAGRGRLGRRWTSDAGAALTVSIGRVLAPASWSGLSLAVGVALAEALHPQVRLKWPNDLWLDAAAAGGGRKLGGVLIETTTPGVTSAAGRYVVVGIGLNLLAPPREPGWAQPAAGWRELEPLATAPALLARVAGPVLQALALFERAGFAPFAAGFAARDALAGRAVRVSAAAGVPLHCGVADGVDPDGALRLRTEGGGLHAIASGDVSVRLQD